MITVYTPFQRKENIDLLANVLKGKANWIVLIDNPELKDCFPDWVTVKQYEKPPEHVGCKSNWIVNQWIKGGLDSETQYMILCDDDSVEEGFFDKIPDEEAVLCSMKRSDRAIRHVVWDDWANQMGHWVDSVDELIADKSNLRVGAVGGEQLILKGKVLRNFRYGLSNVGDGEMILKVAEEYAITYVPDAFVLFNYFEDGRYSGFKRDIINRTKPVVLFIGDYFCAGDPRVGLSEWEGNIWSSLESTGLVDVARFHFDKFYWNTGQRADQALIERIEAIRPDYIVLIIYKFLGSDPAVMLPDTLGVLSCLGIPIITIWGDLEAQQQRDIAATVRPFTKVNIGTANKEDTESVGFKYMHVPKDPRIWNNPEGERDIDVIFLGSYGLGREERQKALQYLIDNGIKLVVGGSEGRDHFPTEEYANGFKRSKIAISFSRAHGRHVTNARVFEILNTGAMMLEQEGDETKKLFEPEKDYVEWKDEVDLLEKVRYYLEHEEERLSIAKSGNDKVKELYSAKSFWEEALKNANEK
jgi:hypothetical protein